MNKLVCLLIFFISQTIFAVDVPIFSPPEEPTHSSADVFFTRAEAEHPELFSPSGQPSEALNGWYYRYYPGTENYIGLYAAGLKTANEIWVLGDVFGGILYVDTLASLLGDIGIYLSPVAPTGQVFCADKTGTAIVCAGTGQDGDLQVGVAHGSPRFTDNGDGTVTDNSSGLVWLTRANCIKTGNPGFDNDGTAGDGRVSWQHALDFVAGINTGTYDCSVTGESNQVDWRLPNVKELHSLIDFQNSNPALPAGHPFSSVVSEDYWSSSSSVDLTHAAWLVDLIDGYVSYIGKAGNYYVWPVRGGQYKQSQKVPTAM